MKMGSGGEPTGADAADSLPGEDRFTGADGGLGKVAVERDQARPLVEQDMDAAGACVTGGADDSRRRSEDRGA